MVRVMPEVQNLQAGREVGGVDLRQQHGLPCTQGIGAAPSGASGPATTQAEHAVLLQQLA